MATKRSLSPLQGWRSWVPWIPGADEQAAATTILHGTIEGLSPSEALAVIPPSARLTVSKEPGALLVHRLESD